MLEQLGLQPEPALSGVEKSTSYAPMTNSAELEESSKKEDFKAQMQKAMGERRDNDKRTGQNSKEAKIPNRSSKEPSKFGSLKSAEDEVDEEKSVLAGLVNQPVNGQQPGQEVEGVDYATPQEKREHMMHQFMDSMESELGIPPQKIVAAMSSLPTEDQNRPPEQTMGKILSQVSKEMDLKPEQVSKAAGLYAKMLKETGYNATVGGGAFAAGQKLAQNDPNQQQMEQKIDQVTDDFMSPSRQRPTPSIESMLSPKSQDPKLPNFFPQNGQEMGGQRGPQMAQNDGYVSGSMFPNSKEDGDTLSAIMKELQNPENTSRENGLGLAKETTLAALIAKANSERSSLAKNSLESVNMESLMDSSEVSGFESLDGFSQQGFSQQGFESSAQDSFSQGRTDFSELPVDEGFSVEEFSSTPFQATRTETQFAPKAVTATSAATALENTEGSSVNDVIQKAQVIARQGGGQVKVQLNSEGLGQVDLKVDVKDGNVNVQMLTDHVEAKKALEGAVSELRTALSTQKLNVEGIKVDVSNDTTSEFRDQNEGDRERGRELAQDFRDRSHQERQAQQGLRHFQAMGRGYLNNSSDETVDPLRSSSLNQMQGSTYGASGRLNLVA